MNLDDYLEELQSTDESFFAMDSVHTGRPITKYIVTGEEEDKDEYIGKPVYPKKVKK